jgi:anthranilate/para-aminobenzoate synthase component I
VKRPRDLYSGAVLAVSADGGMDAALALRSSLRIRRPDVAAGRRWHHRVIDA